MTVFAATVAGAKLLLCTTLSAEVDACHVLQRWMLGMYCRGGCLSCTAEVDACHVLVGKAILSY